MFDGRQVRVSHFAGNGAFLDYELSDDPTLVKHCAAAFEAVWELAPGKPDGPPDAIGEDPLDLRDLIIRAKWRADDAAQAGRHPNP